MLTVYLGDDVAAGVVTGFEGGDVPCWAGLPREARNMAVLAPATLLMSSDRWGRASGVSAAAMGAGVQALVMVVTVSSWPLRLPGGRPCRRHGGHPLPTTNRRSQWLARSVPRFSS